jgi:hypothetical protein
MVGETIKIDLYELRLSMEAKKFEVGRYLTVKFEPLLNQNDGLNVLVAPFFGMVIVIHSHPRSSDHSQLVNVALGLSVAKHDQAASVIWLHDKAIGKVPFVYFGGVSIHAIDFDQMSLRPKLFSHVLTSRYLPAKVVIKGLRSKRDL